MSKGIANCYAKSDILKTFLEHSKDHFEGMKEIFKIYQNYGLLHNHQGQRVQIKGEMPVSNAQYSNPSVSIKFPLNNFFIALARQGYKDTRIFIALTCYVQVWTDIVYIQIRFSSLVPTFLYIT